MRLKCEYREERGKNENRRLRKSGYIPAVIYGKNHETLPIKMKLSDYLKFRHATKNKKILELDYFDKDGQNEEKAVIVKDFSMEPVKKEVMHFDFYEFNKGENIHYKVPVHIKGQAEGVKQGGVLQHNIDEIEIECLPKYAIDFIEIDVTPLGFHDTIRIKDLGVGENVKLLEDAERVVVTVVPPTEEAEDESEIADEATEPEVIKAKQKEE
jgi:large subunit ribosomal protein L25